MKVSDLKVGQSKPGERYEFENRYFICIENDEGCEKCCFDKSNFKKDDPCFEKFDFKKCDSCFEKDYIYEEREVYEVIFQ